MREAIRVALDAMGGDNAPGDIVQGAVEALENPLLHIILVGKEEAVNTELAKYQYDGARILVWGATQVIEADEQPTQAMRHKKDSSMMAGLNLLKQKEVDAFVSAGNTGALLAGATLNVGRIRGIERPALATLLPNRDGFSLIIDVGANVDAKPSYLAQFACMGAVYMETVMGKNAPRVGLLNIGAEREKGNALVKEAYGLLENAGINFIGNVEARDVPAGVADVIVCDAFTGNVLLKYTEGFALALLGMVKDELLSTTLSKAGAFLCKGAFANLKKSFSYEEVGGAPFLGLNGLVVKAHGSSNPRAIQGAINQCTAFVENGFIEKLKTRLN